MTAGGVGIDNTPNAKLINEVKISLVYLNW